MAKGDFDYPVLIAILFGVVFGGIYLINKLAPDIMIDLGPFMFIALLAVSLFAVFKLYSKKPIELRHIFIFGGIIVAVIVLLIKYPQIAPNFSVIAKQILPSLKCGGVCG